MTEIPEGVLGIHHNSPFPVCQDTSMQRLYLNGSLFRRFFPFSGFRAAELAIQDIRQGSHDGIVFAAVLEEGAIGLLGFHIAGLGGLSKGLGEDALHEDLRI